MTVMVDIGFELGLFDDAYKAATAANAKGDIPTAKKHFMRAAELMEEIAEKGEPALRRGREERARKLKYIAENLRAEVAADDGVVSEDRGKSDIPSFINATKPDEKISFDDIIGLDEAKSAIHRLLIDPLKNPAAYARYGIKAGGFILLEGPPGTGKTTFAKAAASELDMPFADVNANSLVDSYIGKTGKNIDKMFAEARALAKSSGNPVVLFIDEIDYLSQKRGGENKTAAEAVPALIKQMEGFSTGADDLVIIAATNIKETLDAAILSRFRSVIHIPLPTCADRRAIFDSKLKNIDAEDLAELDLNAAAEASDGFSGRDITQVALDLKNALAARDAKIRPIDRPLSEFLMGLIYAKRM